jgi:hypothetical protein
VQLQIAAIAVALRLPLLAVCQPATQPRWRILWQNFQAATFKVQVAKLQMHRANIKEHPHTTHMYPTV